VQTLAHDPSGVAAHIALSGPGEIPAHDVGGNGATTLPDPIGVRSQDVGGNGVCTLLRPSGIVALWVVGIYIDAGTPICDI